jgi:D-alanine-D-alanine ligase
MEEKNQENLRKAFKGEKIGVLMGGMSSEREISKNTGSAIIKALQKRGYNAVPVDVDNKIADILQKNNIEVAFIALHGSLGEDGTIQGLLEILRIPYTGSGILASALSINKVASKIIFSYHGLPTPSFQSFCADEDEVNHLQNQIKIPLPFVIKPSEEGSTIGVSIIEEKKNITDNLKKALQYSREILIEKFIHGRELTVGILNGRPLPLVEICPKSGFYDYKSKYTRGETEYIISPNLDKEKADEIKDIAVRAFTALGCRGVARVDFILSTNGSPFILEINTIPGMTETSLLPMAAKQAGIDFESLVEKILWGSSLYKKVPKNT